MKINKPKQKSGIYCITNVINNKKYVGSSINLYDRLQKHRSMLRKNYHQNRLLQNSWNKHSEENFECYVLEYCDESILEQREQFYIDSLNPEYNITKIVERNILSKESRLLQSETRKRRIASGDIKIKGKEIYQYNLNGEFIKKYDTIKKACVENKIHQSTICRFLNGTYNKGGGFLWSLKYELRLKPYKKVFKNENKLKKAIKIVDSTTKEVKHTFTSLKECASYFHVRPSDISYAIKIKQHFKRKFYILFNI